MKDLIILTDKPITNTCGDALTIRFKDLKLQTFIEDYIYFKNGNEGFEMWFSPNDVLDDPDSMMDDTVGKCPNKKAHLTNLSYTSKEIAKEVIKFIEPFYGNMWIQSDEIDNWFGTAQEFIDNY